VVISLAEGPLRAPGSPKEEWEQLAPSLVLGIRSHYSVIHTAVLQSAMGVVFWPGGARVFFDSPADAFYNESVPLDLLWGSKAANCETVCERQAPHIRSVLDVTKEVGLSRRRLAQLFREQVGLTPKLFCRLHRFQGVLRQIALGAPVDWADLALAGGYCDQAHVGHEFREFSGMSPSAYLASQRTVASHPPID
jgi:AraC-like DNA-binding protein